MSRPKLNSSHTYVRMYPSPELGNQQFYIYIYLVFPQFLIRRSDNRYFDSPIASNKVWSDNPQSDIRKVNKTNLKGKYGKGKARHQLNLFFEHENQLSRKMLLAKVENLHFPIDVMLLSNRLAEVRYYRNIGTSVGGARLAQVVYCIRSWYVLLHYRHVSRYIHIQCSHEMLYNIHTCVCYFL